MARLFTASVIAALLFCQSALAGLDSKSAMYVGGTWTNVKEGTEGSFDTSNEKVARFTAKGATTMEIPYDKVTSLEYGQKAGRRIGVAIMVSPLALFSKKRKHYLTIGYTEPDGKKHGVVLELGKNLTRPVLTSLEARTGKQVEYESEDAKKNIGN